MPAIKKIAVISVACLTFAATAYAADRHLERAMELVDMMDIQSLYTNQRAAVVSNLQARVQDANLAVPDGYSELVTGFVAELEQITDESFDWEKDKLAIAEMYSDHFDERELRDVMEFQEKRLEWEEELRKFEASEVGRKYAESAIKLKQEYDVITARRVAELQMRFNQALTRIRAQSAEAAEVVAAQ
ncbi:hypothetical protein [Pseudohongiella nitratireducens]|uniref:hypothetical protein n=1 Tax=Pseudohongiella nitratireducens TaxID=1768907 RepID=UPI0030EDE7B9